MPNLFQIKTFLQFYLTAKTKYSTHSPFVADFINNVLDTSKNYYAHYPLQHLRKLLKKDQRIINTDDHGAGSLVNNKHQKTVSQIANSALSSEWQCKLMFNLINYYQSNSILELGSSLGLSTLYFSKANTEAEITTIEGDVQIAKIAKENFQRLEAGNINIKTGTFSDVLPSLDNSQKYDLIFIDGHHTEQATLEYYAILKEKLNPKGILVFDDIYWSPGMKKAWNQLKAGCTDELTIDLYFFGIIFKDTGIQSSQHVKLVTYRWKPFDLGLFARKQ